MHMLIAIQDSAAAALTSTPEVTPAPAAPLGISALILLLVVGSGFVIGWSR